MRRKGAHHEEEEKLERWLVSYADFITLLFAFFSVLYAMSISKERRYQEALEAIQKAFKFGQGGISPLKNSPFSPFEKAPERGPNANTSTTDLANFARQQKEAMKALEEKVRQLLEKSLGAGLHTANIQLSKTDSGYKIRLGDNVFYKAGGVKLRKEFLPFLVDTTEKLIKLNVKIQIEGHTDNSSPTNFDSNWHLSFARAYNLMRFMVEGVGYPSNRISVASFADTLPIADNSTAEGRAQNRRVEIAIITQEPKLVTDLSPGE